MRVLVILAFITLTSCAHLHSVSITQVPAERTRKVSAKVSRTIFLLFNFDNNYIENLSDKLRIQCPGGRIEGVLTKHEVLNYVLVQTIKVSASGYCNQAKGQKT